MGPPRPTLAHNLGLVQWQQPAHAQLRFYFCQALIQHLISTFIKFVIFLRKPNKNVVSKDEVRSVTGGPRV